MLLLFPKFYYTCFKQPHGPESTWPWRVCHTYFQSQSPHFISFVTFSEMCSLSLQMQGSRFSKQKYMMPFFFFWFWLAAQRSIWDLSSQNVSMKVARSCPTLCNPLGILQARILEWVAVPFSRGSSQPRSRTQVSCIARGFFTSWATRVIPRLGIKSVAPVLKAWSLSHWTTGKSQHNAWIQISDNPLSFNINISHESNPQYDEYRQ